MTINVERLRQGIEALRSGEFQQTKGLLHRSVPDEEDERRGVGYCCLGVLTAVAQQNGCEIPEQIYDDGEGEVKGPYNLDRHAFLHSAVSEWYGLLDNEDSDSDWSNPRLTFPDGEKLSATEANDGKGKTFAEIADAFENTFILPKTEEETVID